MGYSLQYTKKEYQQRKTNQKEYENLGRELENYLGTKVTIKPRKIEINYENTNDLNRILEIINFNK